MMGGKLVKLVIVVLPIRIYMRLFRSAGIRYLSIHLFIYIYIILSAYIT